MEWGLALVVPELKVETQFQNSGTWRKRIGCGAEPPEANSRSPSLTLPPSSSTFVSRSCTSRSLFASLSCSVHLDRRFDHLQSLTRLFLCCTQLVFEHGNRGFTLSTFETREHSSNPPPTTPNITTSTWPELVVTTIRSILTVAFSSPFDLSAATFTPQLPPTSCSLHIICSTSYPHRPFV